MTSTEVRLWEMLRDRRFADLKFRRQTSLAGVTVDFYCAELGLAIELDGGVHALREGEDAERDARLARAGFTVLRFGNEAFLKNPNVLLDGIRRHAADLAGKPPHPSGSA